MWVGRFLIHKCSQEHTAVLLHLSRHQDTLWTHACPETRLAGKLDPWKSGWIKIWAGKKAYDCNFGAYFFLTLTAYALYKCDQTSKSGRVNLNRCAGSQMLIHGYKQPHGPFTLSLQGWNWWNSNQKQKSLVLKPSVPLLSGLRCSLSPMTRLTKLWIPIPIPLPGERNPQRIQVSRCRRRLKALAVKSSDPTGSRGQVTWCYSLPHLHANRRCTNFIHSFHHSRDVHFVFSWIVTVYARYESLWKIRTSNTSSVLTCHKLDWTCWNPTA